MRVAGYGRKFIELSHSMGLTQGGLSLGVEQTPAAAAHSSFPAAALAIHKYFVMREEMGYIRSV